LTVLPAIDRDRGPGGKLKAMSDAEAAANPEELLDNADPQAQNGAVAAAGRQGETHMGFARTLAMLLFIVALPVAIVTTNIRLLANAPVIYDYSFDRYNAEDTTGLSRADLDSTAGALRRYFNSNEKTFYHTVTEGGLTGPVFNARETRHMEDVKQLFVWVNRVQELSVIFVLVYVVVFFIWVRDGDARQLAVHALVGLGLGALVLGGIGIVAAFGFDAAFTRFHELFFANDFWQLDPKADHLIQMFPEKFWRDITIALGAMCALEAALIAAISGIYLMGTRGERRQLAGSLDVGASSTQAA
jgi:integral membrane protein (TIGR01906 family)